MYFCLNNIFSVKNKYILLKNQYIFALKKIFLLKKKGLLNNYIYA